MQTATQTAEALAAQNAGLMNTAARMIASDPEMVAAVANGTAAAIIDRKMAEAFATILRNEERLIEATRANENGLRDRWAAHIWNRLQ